MLIISSGFIVLVVFNVLSVIFSALSSNVESVRIDRGPLGFFALDYCVLALSRIRIIRLAILTSKS